MNKVYDEGGIVLYQGNAWVELPESFGAAVVTGPPYYENPSVAEFVTAGLRPEILICQWDEREHGPPSPLPLVAVHAWVHGDRERWQAFYHFAKDGLRRESRAFLHPPVPADLFVPHPHRFPLALARWLIEMIPPHLIICDPFAGSGTTLLAARNLGRKAVGIELEEQYCDLIIRRLRA